MTDMGVSVHCEPDAIFGLRGGTLRQTIFETRPNEITQTLPFRKDVSQVARFLCIILQH